MGVNVVSSLNSNRPSKNSRPECAQGLNPGTLRAAVSTPGQGKKL